MKCSGEIQAKVPLAIPLSRLQRGERAIVHAIVGANHVLSGKLLAMGVVEGALVELVCRAPLGDPIEVKIWGSRLGMRLSEAACVLVYPHSA